MFNSQSLGFSPILFSGNGNGSMESVTSYADLPDASLHTGEYYIVDTTTGTWILGTKKSAGIYKSNGTNWIYIDNVPETTSLSDGTTNVTGTNIILEAGNNMEILSDPANNKLVLTATSSGGTSNGGNIYFTLDNSDVSGYYNLSNTLPPTEQEVTIVLNNSEEVIHTYIYPDQINTTSIDAGNWLFSYTAKVSTAVGITQIKAEVFLYHTDTTETVLFSGYSEEINNTDYLLKREELNQSGFSCSSTDRLGVRIYGKTTSSANVTLYTIVGDGRASYLIPPLKLRHSQLRNLNGDSNYLHVTSSDISNWNNKYDSTNFVAGTNYLAPNGNGAGLTGVLTSSLDMDTANFASNSPSFTVTNANTRTKVNNFVAAFDNISNFDATNQKIIIKKSGYHTIYTRIYPNTAITGNIEVSYYLNGSNYGSSVATCNNNLASASLGVLRYFSVNDEIEIYALCSVASTVVKPYVNLEWRGANI